jgi:hypothetical protein
MSYSSVFSEYEQIFKPHVEEYMKNKGFYTAALELLMPDFRAEQTHGHGTGFDRAG